MIEKKVITIIPARGGSKEIPNKNIIKLGEKELIGYTIEAAINSGVSDKVIVDTDDLKIAEISKSYGAEIPYIRPSHLAGDFVPPIDVVLNCFDWFENRGYFYDIFIYLQPTSPFRNSEIIKQGMDFYINEGISLIATVNKSSCIPDRISFLDDKLTLKAFSKNDKVKLVRQLIGQYYELNGAMIIGDVWKLKNEGTWFLDGARGYNLEYPYFIDIDTYEDLAYAEFVMRKYELD